MRISIAVALSLVSAISFLASLLCILALFRRRARGRDPEAQKPATRTPPTPKRCTWAEIECATSNFTSAVIGKGGFCTVYSAVPAGAVKIHHSSSSSSSNRQGFQSELEALLRVHQHPYIVRLLGYCDAPDSDGALILELAPNGSLHDRLQSDGPALPWANRALIAVRLAQAVDYLHDGCEVQIVHGDIKASNVLLDAGLSPKLCDFGCARIGFSAAVRPPPAITGSPGYLDPHYLRTGLISKKTDVYAFGVLLLELITGREAFDADTHTALAVQAGQMIPAGDLAQIVDRRLSGEYDRREASVIAAIAALCIGENPSMRPSMADVGRIMKENLVSEASAIDCKSYS